jgi:putative ABC transport system permease protein
LRTGSRPGAGEVSPDIAITFQPLALEIRDALTRERLMAALSGFFGALAALLAALGLYGVIAHSVSRRTKEIGIRMALGADRGGILRMILSEAGTGSGLLAGTLLALASARVAGSLLFGVQPWDPATLAVAAACLAVVALAASALPAARAARLEPVLALREE